MRRLPSPLLASLPSQARRALSSHPPRCLAHDPGRDSGPGPDDNFVPSLKSTEKYIQSLPFRFKTGIALFAKRTPRPFPPPFLSPPSGSFSDPLSTHRDMFVHGRLIRGYTNGDDAVYESPYFIAANDGVGAWSTRPRGHAGLWSRLILHFWALEVQRDAERERLENEEFHPKPIQYLQRAYERTLDATAEPNNWYGTTTASGAQLHYKTTTNGDKLTFSPLLYVTNLGDSQVMVVRPNQKEAVFKTQDQWHWFDCPRQLGTNSPDTPADNAAIDILEIQEGDVVLAMSDGVTDNLWEHEIVANVQSSIKMWGQRGEGRPSGDPAGGNGRMKFVAEELVTAAKVIALDPFAESPFMEHAIEEGLPSHGGKLDDISVVAALCTKNDT